MKYDHLKIESKWQKMWQKDQVFVTDLYDFSKPKFYVLDMFPYPSGEGLHVGHPRGYTASDIVARMKRMQGFNVFHPIGWDAFGLPAEQYALKTNNHPEQFTKINIATFKRQLEMLGFSYDWSKELATTDPDYVKWTQWIFLKLLAHDLAYIDEKPVNYCPELGTVLANEEVIDGKSEVGGYPVIKKWMKQWMLKITAYAPKLLDDLVNLNWPISTLAMQRNWIGRSEGTEITFKIKDSQLSFDVFTTRADTLFGATYCTLAPEHPLIKQIVKQNYLDQVNAYIEKTVNKSDLERTELNKEKSGVFTGAYAINPINNEQIPIWIADYVLISYGSGAVMAVPAHDQRDYEFAKAHHLPIKPVLKGDISQQAFIEDGQHINSDFINGHYIANSKKLVTEKLISLNAGRYIVQYKLRDWLFSRQRYWGEPIPVVFLDEGKSIVALKEEELPLRLPLINDYKPNIAGLSPLANDTDWVNITYNGQKAVRETNTMPQWAGSCWYYLRYLDPHNSQAIADKKLIDHWLPVDLYIGGAEHAVLHLLYARFWHKFLYDLGIVSSKEPFQKLFHQGMILGENHEKMSKSRGNVINPDTIIERYGSDTLRLYEMFMGPLEASLPWSQQGLDGAYRFIERVIRLITDDQLVNKHSSSNNGQLDYVYHYTVKKVSEDYENLQMNTAIAQLMIFVNEAYKADAIYLDYLQGFLKLLAPVCPHIAEELWIKLGQEKYIAKAVWPTFEQSKLVRDLIPLAIQVNGKLRATINIAVDLDEETLKKLILAEENIVRHLNNQPIKRWIIIKNKIVNLVI